MSGWDQYLPVSDSALDCIEELRLLCGGNDLPTYQQQRDVERSPSPTPPEGEQRGRGDESSTPSGARRRSGRGKQSVSDLYAMYYNAEYFEEDVLGDRVRERLGQLRCYREKLHGFTQQVEQAVNLLQDISTAQGQVSTKTSSLHHTCQTLLQEEKVAKERVTLLSEPLSYFNALRELGPQLGMPLIGEEDGGGEGSRGAGGMGRQILHPGSDEFEAALVRITECVAYLEQHAEFMEASKYINWFGQLQARGLALVKNQVIEYLDQAARVAAGQEVSEGQVESSLVYQKFRAIAPRVQAHLSLLRRHAITPPLKALVYDCQLRYLEIRLELLRPAAKAHLKALSSRDIVSMTRFSSVFFIRLGQLETQLYDSCFGESNPTEGSGSGSGTENGLYEMLLALCSDMYEHLRPLLLHDYDMDQLCDVISVVREELVEEHRSSHGKRQVKVEEDGTQRVAIETVLQRLIQDAQERLIFCANRILRLDIEKWKPEPGHLDYPGVLERLGKVSTYDSWYPPLRITLMVLSKMYRTVDIHVFEDMAQQAVVACTRALLEAAALIHTSKAADDPGNLDGQLFLIQHLLILRDQLAPFDIAFVGGGRRLNFSTTKSALKAFVRSAPGIFRLSRENPLLKAAQDGLPMVDEFQVDAKHDMEEALKAACNGLIGSATSAVADGLINFLAKVRAFHGLDVPDEGETSQPIGGVAGLRQQSFMQHARVLEMMAGAAATAEATLPGLAASMALYLPNSLTRGILLQPILRRVAELVVEGMEMCSKCFDEEEMVELYNLKQRVLDAVTAAEQGTPNVPETPRGPPMPASLPSDLEEKSES